MNDEQGAGQPSSFPGGTPQPSDTYSAMQPSLFHPSGRPTWVEINLDHLAHNFHLVKQTLGEGVAVMAAIKADAYGHSAIHCASRLEREGADWFGVALPEEGLALREAGITRPILCLGGFWEGQEDALLAHQLTPVIYRLDTLERYNEAAQRQNQTANYHLKVDTGMGRLGVPHGELEAFLKVASAFTNVRLDGAMTHFASSDLPDKDAYTQQQIVRFDAAQTQIAAHGHTPTWVHEANSATLLAYPQARGNLVRPGGVLYGLWRDVINPKTPTLDWQPVLSLRTRIIHIKSVAADTPLGYGCTFKTWRESRIATLAIGYEDGLPRTLSNRGRVLVHGNFAPIVGRVSMDLTIIDVTDIPDARLNDEVTVIGRQGANRITAEEIAAQIGTLSYEITCGISERVPRRVVVGS